MKDEQIGKMKGSIRRCARCGTDHDVIVFTELRRPIEDSDGTVWNWWTLCPITGEPVLMKMEPSDSPAPPPGDSEG